MPAEMTNRTYTHQLPQCMQPRLDGIWMLLDQQLMRDWHMLHICDIFLLYVFATEAEGEWPCHVPVLRRWKGVP
jgi:hypothetical protein